MSRRPPPREYYSSEEEIYEVDRIRERGRERPPRPRQRDRDRIIGDDVDVDIDYHHRRRSSPPLEDDLEERLRLRERGPLRPPPRSPRDFMREGHSSLPREGERDMMVRRRSREELDVEFSPEGPRPVSPPEREREMVREKEEKVYIRPPGPRRRARPRSREVDVDEEVLFQETERYKSGGGRRRRSTRGLEIEDDEVVIRQREREGDPRLRSTRELEIEDDDVILRRREEGVPRRRGYKSEEEIRIRDRKKGGGKRHDDERDEEVYIRSSRPRRPPPREVKEEVVMLGDSDEENRRSSTRRRGEFVFEDDEVVIRRKPREPPYRNPRFEDDQFQPMLVRSDDDDDDRLYSRNKPRPRFIDFEDDDEETILMKKYEKDRSRREGRREVDVDIQWKRDRGSAHERSSSVEAIRAPPIHQDVFTHHRHIDHGMKASRSVRRSSPEFRSGRGSIDELDIHRRSTRNGVRSEEEITLKRDEVDSISPSRHAPPEFYNPWEHGELSSSRQSNKSVADESELLVVERTQSRPGKGARSARDIEEEILIRRSRKDDTEQVYDTTDEWSVVRSPSKPDSVEMTGALRGDPEQDSKRGARVAQQVMDVKDEKDSRWTEITKNLVVREAIERMGYEYEETRMFYYIISYLEPRDIDELVELSDEIRQARRRRIHEIHRERASLPPLCASLDRLPPRPRMVEEKLIRERDWIVDSRRG